MTGTVAERREVRIRSGRATLIGDLVAPAAGGTVVVFSHGASGARRRDPRDRRVAAALERAGMGTLLVDLVTPTEEEADLARGHLRFDVGFLAARLLDAMEFVHHLEPRPAIGLVGSSAGAAAAFVAAGERPAAVAALVARGGRPDLAERWLPRIRAPTLLVVGGRDEAVLALNRTALERLGTAERKLVVVPGAAHLFEEPGALDHVAALTVSWFATHPRPL